MENDVSFPFLVNTKDSDPSGKYKDYIFLSLISLKNNCL